MSVSSYAFNPEVRSFNSPLEVEDSQSEAGEGSIPHDAVGDCVLEDVWEDRAHSLECTLMLSAPAQRTDIMLDTPESPRRSIKLSDPVTAPQKDQESDTASQRNAVAICDTQSLSQSTRNALSELSTNTVIMPKADGGKSPWMSPLDENGSSEGAEPDSRALIKDTNARRISPVIETTQDENREQTDSSKQGKTKVKYVRNDLDNHVEGYVASIEQTIKVEQATAIDSTDVGGLKTSVVVEHIFEKHSTELMDQFTEAIDRRTRGFESTEELLEDRASTSEDTRRSHSAEILRQSFNPLETPTLSTAPDNELPLHSSSGSRKRKTATYSKKESTSIKRHKKSSISQDEEEQEPQEEETITVEPIANSKQVIPNPDTEHGQATKRTSRTSKRLPILIQSVSPTTSTKSRTMSKSRKTLADVPPGRSRRIPVASSTHFEEYFGLPPKVSFSSTTTVNRKKDTMNHFVRLGGQEVKRIEKANMLIIGGAALKKTVNLIIAVARGMDVVNERWIVECKRKNALLDILPFLPEEENHKADWGTTLAEAINRGKEGVLQQLLQDTTVYTTRSLDNDTRSRDLSPIVKSLGGNIIKGSLPSTKSRTRKYFLLGTKGDLQAAEAQRMGHKLFDKDLLILGALRGKIDTDSPEFLIDVPVKEDESQ